jgi:site-specific recombinase
MMESLYPFFEWCEFSLLGQVVRQSLWLFPVIEAFHLVAFALLGGTILLVDLRLLGLIFRQQPAAELWSNARHWRRGALVAMFITGVLLFLSEAVKCYYSIPFRIKMVALFAGIVFSFVVTSRVARADEARLGPFWGKLAAIVSIVIWGTVAWGGRWIGFSG